MPDDISTPDLTARLRFAREYLNFTREDVAHAMRCDPADIEHIEDGTTIPRPATLARLGKLYRRPVEWFHGQFQFTPGPGILRMQESIKSDHDREAFLDFAEFLACKKQTESAPPEHRQR